MLFKKSFLDFLFKVSDDNVTCHHVTPTMWLMPKTIKKIEIVISSTKSLIHPWAAETKKIVRRKRLKNTKKV